MDTFMMANMYCIGKIEMYSSICKNVTKKDNLSISSMILFCKKGNYSSWQSCDSDEQYQ